MTAPSPVRVLGLSGSLRRASYNTALLRAACELGAPGMTIDVFDLAPLPFYNQDLVANPGEWPASVAALREAIAASDAVLIASPEYNYSIPAVLKNAIDWASRPPAPVLDGKPVAIMGATGGNFGTVRMQLHLRQVFVFTNMLPLNKPEVLVARAHEKFDAEGRLTDEPTRELVGKQLAALAAWTRRLRGDAEASR